MYNNFEISLVVFMSNITTNHSITYTKSILYSRASVSKTSSNQGNPLEGIERFRRLDLFT